MARFSTASGGCEAAEHRGGDSRAQGELVIGPSGNVRVLVATKPVDFRKGAEGLAALVRETMRTDPFSGVVYVFRAKRADRVKLIFWDGTGVVLVSKRLENGKFSWPAIDNGVMRLSAAQLQALLEGLDWRRVHESRRTTVPAAAS
jgi:transposase